MSNREDPRHAFLFYPSDYLGDTVCDPFCGSGSTGVACAKLNRKFVGIELSEAYCDIARKRIADVAPLFDSVKP